jgi:hypothetical protein
MAAMIDKQPERRIMKNLASSMCALLACLLIAPPLMAVDSDTSRQTLSRIKGIYVLVEELQPNIRKPASRLNFTSEQLQKEIESRFQKAGITVLNRDEWLKTIGRPVLYLNVNTHEREKYWWAYDIRLEFQQIASLEVNPKVKTLVSTWSVNITGTANIGSLTTLTDQVKTLADIFIKAYQSVNQK